MKKLTQKQLLTLEKCHRDIELKCGPIIDKILSEYFPNMSPEDLGQLAIHDNEIGGLMSGYIVATFWKEIAMKLQKQ